MAFGLADLVSNIVESVKGLGGLFSKKNVGPYPQNKPEIKRVLSEIIPANWNKSIPYTFSVTNNDGDFGDFELPLSPSELGQDETFAISFRATQGGTVVNRGQSRYKDLIISGTTGVAPFRGAGGVERSTGKAIFQPNTLKYRSGYEVFQHLRNWFRAYDQWKGTDNSQIARTARMVFKNFKDGEFLFVELIKFSMKKSASRKNLYDYNLAFRVLGPQTFDKGSSKLSLLQTIDALVQDVKDKIDLARGILLRSQDILRQVEATYESTVLEPMRKTSLAAKAFLGIGTVAADMGRQAITNTVSAVGALTALVAIQKQGSNSSSSGNQFTPADKASVSKALTRLQNNKAAGVAAPTASGNPVANLLNKSDILMKVDSSVLPASAQAAMIEELAKAKTLPRKFFSDFRDDLVRVRDNAADKFNLGSSVYNAQYQRVSTEIVESTKVATDAEYQVLYAFSIAIAALEKMLSINGLFGGTYVDRLIDVQSRFTDNLKLQSETAMKSIVMPQDTDLERLALQQLGDSSRWIEIAELNDLKPPYVIQDQSDTTPNVIHPGQNIEIPTTPISGFSNTPQGKPSYFNEQLSEVERNLGTDIKLDKNFDFSMTNRNDLQLVSGLENAAQSLMLSLMYEPGDLIKHPEIGVGLEAGSKFPSLGEIQSSLFRTLSLNPKFDGVDNVEIVREGGTLKLKFTAKIKNVDIPIPITVPL